MKKWGVVILLVLVLLGKANSQIVINEICSSNSDVFEDEFGKTPDWIELANNGTEVINLGGYSITNNTDIPEKWKLPSVEIQPGGFLLILASDRGIVSDFIHTNFKISKEGEAVLLFDSSKSLVDKILVPELEEDTSFGLDSDGDKTYFSSPTPGEMNNSSSEILRTPAPLFSESNQFQAQPFFLDLEPSDDNVAVHFTLDGSIPTEMSPVYDESVFIEKNTTVRAFSKKMNQIHSEVVTNTYFINEQSTLPVLAASLDSLLLFDEMTGIFMPGPDAESEYPYFGSNFWKDIGIPAHVEYFTSAGDLLIEFSAEGKVHGGRSSRTKPQKSMRFLAKPKYGSDKIDFSFFEDKPEINSFSKIVIRNSSGDYNLTHFRDGFLSRYLKNEGLDLDLSGYQPVQFFINGKYWGVINLREKTDESYLVSNYNVELDKVDVLEEDTLIIHGDRDIFVSDVDFIKNSDLTSDGALEAAGERFDFESLVDYIIAETAINNTDWGHNNLKLWRERIPGGKWRYLMFDLDVAMEGRAWTKPEFSTFISKMNEYGEENPHFTVWKKLLTNRKFRNYFINRYCDLLNTVFRPEHFADAVEKHAEKMATAMVRHFDRWGMKTGYHSFENWESNAVPKVVNYCLRKAPYARNDLQQYFELEDEIQLKLNIYPEGAGKIKINTIIPDELPWSGYYFKGVPVELTIIPNSGFEFIGWELLNAEHFSSTAKSVIVDFPGDEDIVAVFKKEKSEKSNLKIFPNPAKEQIEVSFELEEKSKVEFEIFAVDGKQLKHFLPENYNIGAHKVHLGIGDLPSGGYFLKITKGGEPETIPFQKI